MLIPPSLAVVIILEQATHLLLDVVILPTAAFLERCGRVEPGFPPHHSYLFARLNCLSIYWTFLQDCQRILKTGIADSQDNLHLEIELLNQNKTLKILISQANLDQGFDASKGALYLD